MNENLFEAQYDVTKKTKLRRFYESNKIIIFSLIFVVAISVVSLAIISSIKEKKKILIGEKYITAKIYVNDGQFKKGREALKSIIQEDDETYSVLAFYLILNENLVTEKNELINLFDHILKNKKISNGQKKLLIFKKGLFQSNFVNETELLNTLKPVINSENIWRPHALLLLGDFFASKKQYLKAREFYTQVLSLKNLNNDIYNQAKSQLIYISNE